MKPSLQVLKPQPNTSQSIKALRLPKVLEKTGLSRSHVYRLILQQRFPKPAHLTERISVWNEADIDTWLAAKFAGSQS
jgi:prophage regulatory protein